MTQNTNILVVDDEPELREMLDEYLGRQGFVVAAAESAAAARRKLEEQSFDLVLLDINMPGEDGLSLARFLREHHRVGIIMLTAASDTVDRIIGLEMGADDYIPKPFDPRELLARIKSVLRRAHVAAAAEQPPETMASTTASTIASTTASTGRTVRFGRCLLDMEAHKLLRENDGVEVPMTSMEFDLLKAFADHPNRVLSRDQLLDLAHNRDWDPFDRSIDMRVPRIRRKVELDPGKPQTIKTVRGVGYIYVP